MDDIEGYIRTGIIWMIGIAALVAVGAIIGGVMFNMRHASKTGAISGAVVIAGGVAYVAFPPIVAALTGSGCG